MKTLNPERVLEGAQAIARVRGLPWASIRAEDRLQMTREAHAVIMTIARSAQPDPTLVVTPDGTFIGTIPHDPFRTMRTD